MSGSLVAQGHDGVHAHGPPRGNPGREERHYEENQEREAEKKRVMSMHLEQQRLEQARREPGPQQTQGRAANRPTGDTRENHTQYALRSGAKRHAHANLARLLLHKETNDPITADRREQDSHTREQRQEDRIEARTLRQFADARIHALDYHWHRRIDGCGFRTNQVRNRLGIDGALNDNVRGPKVAASLILPGKVELGIRRRSEAVILYISGNADDRAPGAL